MRRREEGDATLRLFVLMCHVDQYMKSQIVEMRSQLIFKFNQSNACNCQSFSKHLLNLLALYVSTFFEFLDNKTILQDIFF